MKPCHLGPIVKHMNGFGFKITFNTLDEAQKYKEMCNWIIDSYGFKVYDKKGFHEREEK